MYSIYILYTVYCGALYIVCQWCMINILVLLFLLTVNKIDHILNKKYANMQMHIKINMKLIDIH